MKKLKKIEYKYIYIIIYIIQINFSLKKIKKYINIMIISLEKINWD